MITSTKFLEIIQKVETIGDNIENYKKPRLHAH